MLRSRSLEAAVQAALLRAVCEELNALRKALVMGLSRRFGVGVADASEVFGSAGSGARMEGCVMIMSVRTWMAIIDRLSD